MLYQLGVFLVIATYASAEPTCNCEFALRPVCGNDGRSFGNPCVFHCAQRLKASLKIVHRGPCADLEGCPCSFDYDPVCGDDGVTYSNECSIECHEVNLAYKGKCQTNATITPN